MSFDQVFNEAAQRFNIDPDLLKAQAHVESNGNPAAVSPAGAIGLMQFMPTTAKSMGFDPTDPVQSIHGAAALMRENLDRYKGDLESAVAAYHGGTDQANWGHKTQAYVAKVASTFGGLKQNAGMSQSDPSVSTGDPVADALAARASAKPVTSKSSPGQAPAAPAAVSNDPVSAALAQRSQQTQADSAKVQQLAQPTYDPTDGMTPWEKRIAGAGKAAADLGTGIQQVGAQVGNWISPKLVSDKTVSDIQQTVDENKHLDQSLMNTTDGTLGYIGGNVATTLLPLGMVARGAQALKLTRGAALANALVNPTTYRAAAGAGAAMASLQPVASDESRLTNTALGALGGVVGQGTVNGIGRLATPVKNVLSPVAQKAVDTLKQAGVPLDLAQVTGSPVWNRVRSALSDNVFTSGGQEAQRAGQQEAFNSAVLGTTGTTANAATSDVMGATRDRLNGVIGDVLSRNNVTLQPQTASALSHVQSTALENDKAPVAKVINRFLDSVDPQTGQVSGQVAYNIKKDLDTMASSQDSTLAKFARDARSAVMDGINSSLSGADQKAFSSARGQMANMFKIEGAIDKQGTGNINPQRLANVLGQKSNRAASVYGNGPQQLVDLAQSGSQLLGDKLPNSGTAARMFMQVIPGLVTGAGTYAATGDPLESAKYAGGVIAAPKIAQALLNNPKAVKALSGEYMPSVVKTATDAITKNKMLAAALMRTPAAALPAPEQ